MLQCCVCHHRLSVCLSLTLFIVAKRCVLEQKLLLTTYRKSYIRNQGTKMNDLHLCSLFGGGDENARVENAGAITYGKPSGKIADCIVWWLLVSLEKSNFNAVLLVNSYLCIVRPVDLLSHFPTSFCYLSCARRHTLTDGRTYLRTDGHFYRVY